MRHDEPGAGIFLRSIDVRFPGDVHALRDVSLDIPAHQIVALVGPSGCGKSTLLRVIAGLQKPTGGRLLFRPASARPAAGDLGYVFQHPSLVPWRSALTNVALPLEISTRLRRSQRESRAVAQLQRVDLGPETHGRRPHELSGGMQMRVSLARALVTDPAVLLLDEPFAALDELLRSRLAQLVLRLWEENRQTVVFVTHNIGEAVLMAHRVAVMRHGAIRETIANPLPWPRDEQLRRDERFIDMYARVARSLETSGVSEVLIDD